MKKNVSAPHPAPPPLTLLGGLSAAAFLQEYWQKKPLLIRNAVPGFEGVLSPDELAGLACEEDAQSRLVLHSRGQWKVEHGPFEEERFGRLPRKDWTLLVQGVNHHLPEAAELLQHFSFIPHARLDDLMVSFAPNGGGVGPHFESYDVFLLQGQGQRRWRISAQQDLTLVEHAPLRILQHFDTEEEWVLSPGDMLYLPPHLAHWGIAIGDCMTYSIGFRAPSAQELGHEFLAFLQEKIQLPGRYADPDLALQPHPAEIGTAMVKQVDNMLRQLQWQEGDVAEFLGHYLSEPKPHIAFVPNKRLSAKAFAERLEKRGIALSLKSLMLFHGSRFYLNGEKIDAPSAWEEPLRQLADGRQLPPQAALPPALVDQLHQWYGLGWLEFA